MTCCIFNWTQYILDVLHIKQLDELFQIPNLIEKDLNLKGLEPHWNNITLMVMGKIKNMNKKRQKTNKRTYNIKSKKKKKKRKNKKKKREHKENKKSKKHKHQGTKTDNIEEIEEENGKKCTEDNYKIGSDGAGKNHE